MVISLLPILCHHDSLTLKFHQKNSYFNEGWLFVGRFKVGSLPRMMNEEVLGQFIYEPILSTEIFFNM